MKHAPICRKCKEGTCEWYGLIGGFSVQCKACNIEKATKQRAARRKARKDPNQPLK